MAQNQIRDSLRIQLYEMIHFTRKHGVETSERSRLIAELYRSLVLVEQVTWEESELPTPPDSSQAV